MRLLIFILCVLGLIFVYYMEEREVAKQVVYAVTDGACALPVQTCEGVVASGKATIVFCSCKPLTEVTYEF